MRKTLLSILAMVLFTILPAQAAQTFYMPLVGFEDGSIPATWTQQSLQGSVNWAVEGGAGATLTRPTGAFSGSYRLAIKGTETDPYYVTRLTLPAVDLSNADDPQLVFSYANPGTVVQGSSKFDTLFVYYFDASTSKWKLLDHFLPDSIEEADSWTSLQLPLPGYAATTSYQLAFEVHGNFGHGVVLDEIGIVQPSQCPAAQIAPIKPRRTEVDFSLTFQPATNYTLVLSVNPLNLPDSVVFALPQGAELLLNNEANNEFHKTGLQPNKQYYVAVRQTCSDNALGWTAWTYATFKTAVLMEVPYVESFDSATIAGWTYGRSTGLSTLLPYKTKSNYYSPDSTNVLFFGSSTTTTSASATLGAGQYVYAAAPELLNANANEVEVSFWGATYSHPAPGVCAPKMWVGVMTDPADVNTFVGVEQVEMESAYQLKHFTVNLSSYTGNGLYVAFKVDGGDVKNVFAIDKVEIKPITVPTPSQIKLTAITPNQLGLQVNKNGADSWNLLIGDQFVNGGVPAAIVSQNAISAATTTVTLPDSLAGKVITVYAQGVKNGQAGAWAFPLTVRVPQALSGVVPDTIAFKAVEYINFKNMQNWLRTSSSAKSPTSVYFNAVNPSNVPTVSSNALSLPGAGNYFTLGYLQTLNDKEIAFLLRGNGSAEGKVELGVMTNPYDLSTFVKLATFEGPASTSEYARCIYDLDQYTGQGHYLAFKAVNAAQYIQAIYLTDIPTCREVSAVNCVPGSSKATLSWDANNMSQWQVVVSTKATFADTVASAIVNTPTYVVTGLTPQKTYYYKVNTICGTDTVQMYGKKQFTTALGVPYSANFDAGIPSNWTLYSGKAQNVMTGAASLTTTTSGWSSQTVGSNYIASSGKSIGWNVYGSGKYYWAVMPELNTADVDGALRMTFDFSIHTYSGKLLDGDDYFMVLVSTDGGATWPRANAHIWGESGDIDETLSTTLGYEKIVPVTVDLTQYVGQSIKIAFYAATEATGGDNYFSVDNVVVSSFDPNCPGISALSATTNSSNAATIAWQMDGTQSADIQVATSESFVDSTLVYNQTVTTSPIVVNGLTGNTLYYIRAKQTCDPNATYRLAEVHTLCDAVTPAEFGVETFKASKALDCWTLGHQVDGTSSTKTNPTFTTLNGFGPVLQFTKTATYVGTTSSTTYCDQLYAFTPAFDVDSLKLYQVVFDAATNSRIATNINRIQIGVLTDPSDLATFEKVKDIQINYAADSTQMRTYIASLKDYDGDIYGDYGKYVMFYAVGNDSSFAILVDNVKLELIPNCASVDEVVVKSVGSTNATMKWAANGAAEYEVGVFTAKSADSTAVVKQITSADSLVVTTLPANTQLYASVRAICGAGDTAQWSPMTAFHTECLSITEYPWTENFDAYTTAGTLAIDCWGNEHIAGTGTKMLRTVTTATGGNRTGKLHLEDEQAGNIKQLTLPLMNIPEANAYEFRFDMYRSNYSTPKSLEGFWILVDGAAGVDTIGIVPRQYTVANDYVGAVAAEGWYTYSFVIPQSGDLNILVWGYSEFGKESFADNFEVRALPTCRTPKKLKVAEVSIDTARIVWEGAAASCIVELAGVEDFSLVLDSTVVTDTTYVFRGLNAGTTYYARVRSNCDGGEWASLSFATALSVPFAEDFQTSTSLLPVGWQRLNGDIYTDSVVSTTVSGWFFTSSEGGGMTPYHAYCSTNYSTTTNYKYALLTPTIQLKNKTGNELTLSFDLALTTSSTSKIAPDASVAMGRHFSVALFTDSIFVPVAVWSSDSLATEGTYASIPEKARHYEVDLTAYSNKSASLVFFHSVGTSTSATSSCINLDNIKLISVNPNCVAPVITIDSVTQHSLNVVVPNTNSSSYMVQLSTIASFASVADSLVITDSVASFAGLKAATTYYVRAKKLCGDGEESAWSETVSAVTECDVYALPLSIDFENMPLGGMTSGAPTCWELINANNGDYPYIYVNNSSSYARDAQSLYFKSSPSVDAYAVLPELAAPIDMLRMQFECKFESVTNSGKLYVGYVDSTLSESSFRSVQEVTRSTAWQNVMVEFKGVPATAARLAFKYAHQGSNYYLGIDNINITLRPLNETLVAVAAKNIERREFDVVWTPKADNTCQQYKLVVSASALSADSLNKVAGILVSDTTAYHVANLERNTTYYVYVRTNCLIDTVYGKWVSAVVKTKNVGPDCSDSAPGEVTTTGTGSEYAPISAFFKNSYTEQIYTASELRAAGLTAGYVSKVAFQYLLTSAYTKTVTIFLGETSDSQVTAANGFYQPDAATVAQSITFDTADKWYEFEMDTPYYWDGSSNLVVGVLGLGTTFWSSGIKGFAGGATTNNMVLYRRSDTDNPLTGMTTTPSSSATRPNIKLSICPPGAACPAVKTATVELLGDGTTSAEISWPASTGDFANTYMFCYADNDSILPDSISTKFTGIDSLSITLTGLTENTQYYGYIGVVCDAEEHNDGVSTWYKVPFLTNANCPAVVDFNVELTGKHTAKASWNTVLADQDKTFAYVLSLDSLSKAELASAAWVNVDTTVLALEGLECDSTYHLYVASRCGATKSSIVEVSFTMPKTCPAVVNLHTNKVAFNAVELAWNRGLYAEETEWEVGAVGVPALTMTTLDSMAIIIGLLPETEYTFYVKPVCSLAETGNAAQLVVTTPQSTGDELTVGRSTSTSSSLPTSLFYNYATSEQIYTAEELDYARGTITGIAFKYDASNTSKTRDIKIYLKHVTKSEFVDDYDWEPVDGGDLVYEGTWNLVANGWNYFDFLTAFDYNGMDNLLVVLDDNTGNYIGSSLNFVTYEDENYSALYKASDSENLNPYNPTLSGTRTTHKNQIKLTFEPGSCPKAANVSVSNVTINSATLSWFPGGSETKWAISLQDHRLSSGEYTSMVCDTLNRVMSQSYTNLQPDQDYYFYIRSLCSASDNSDWKVLKFTTLPICGAPTGLKMDTVTAHTVTLSWKTISVGTAQSYVVAYGVAETFNLADSATYATAEATDTVAVISGLEPTTVYTFVVRAVCGENDESRWSAPLNVLTDCDVISVFPHAEGFDNPDLWAPYGTTNNYPICWITTGYNNQTTYTPRVQPNTASYQYAASDTAAIYVTSNSSYASTWPSMLISPELVGDLDTLLLKFKMRACYQSYSTGNVSSGYYSSSYAKSIKVGSMSALSLDSIHEIQTCTLEGNYAYGDALNAANNYGWEEFEVRLAGVKDPYITLYSDFDQTNYVWIDDIRFEPLPPCVRPLITVDSVGVNAAKLSWEAGADSWNAYLVEDNDTTFYNGLTSNMLLISNLFASTNYTFYVQGVCGSETSGWGKVKFTTSCDAVTVFPWIEDFEAYASGDYLAPCTENIAYREGTGSSGSTGLLFKVSTSSQSGNSTHMLQLPDQMAGTLTRLYLPEMLLDSASQYFFSLDIYRGSASYYTNEGIRIYVENAAGALQELTFISRNYSTAGALVPAEAAPAWYTYEFELPNNGQVCRIVLQGESAYGSSTYMDNFKVEEKNESCLGVTNITASNVTTHDADVAFNYVAGATNAVVELSTRSNFASLIASDTIMNDSVVHYSNLVASTKYYVRAKQICGTDEESAYTVADFMTGLGLPFVADFSDGIPSNWSRYSYWAADSVIYTKDFGSSSTWSKVAADTVIDAAHIRANLYGTSFNHWLVTPAIDFTENVGDGMMLNVDLGLTAFSSYSADRRNNGYDDKFAVYVSVDGGISWDPANVTVWSNDTVNPTAYVYNEIPEHAQTYRINMTQYAGKVVKIGFYGESTQSNADNYFHFGNIRLDKVASQVYTDTVCAYTSYSGYGFTVKAKDLVPGQETAFDHFTPAVDSLHQDSITVLKLYARPEQSVMLYDTICAGSDYSGYGFNIEAATIAARVKEGTYEHRWTGTDINGCDSVVSLYLNVKPVQETEEVIRFCKSQGYIEVMFHGEPHRVYGNQVLRDTLTGVNGCDSIHTIRVMMSEEGNSEYFYRTAICQGDSMEWNGTFYKKAGVYTDTIVTEFHCDSVATLSLLIANDSVIYDTIRTDELPYLWEGNSIYSTNVTPGTYRRVVSVKNCGTRTLVLTVLDGTGYIDLMAEGEDKAVKFIHNDKVYIRRQGKLYNSLGQRVSLED